MQSYYTHFKSAKKNRISQSIFQKLDFANTKFKLATLLCGSHATFDQILFYNQT